MTRIVAGKAKGRKLLVPGEGTRPTSAKVREALFSKLDGWNLVKGARVLDLFAGSGALGLEAFSRGAQSVVLVEKSREAQKIIATNMASLKASPAVTLFRGSAEQYLRTDRSAFDVIMVDPPYFWENPQVEELLAKLADLLTDDGLIVVERDGRTAAPAIPKALVLEDHRRWGDTAAWLFGKKHPGEEQVD